MTAHIDALANTIRLIDSIEPGCDVTTEGERLCTEPAEWIERYRCGCDAHGQLLACTHHHHLLPILIRERICDECCHEPELVGAEPLWRVA